MLLSVLIVDDEASQMEVLSGYLQKKGYAVRQATSAAKAMEVITMSAVDIVLTDYKMPGRTGGELLKDIKNQNPETTVVLMTAFGTIEGAVAALQAGAYDYLTKPIDLEDLDLMLQRIGERRRLISENRLLREQLREKYSFRGIVYQSSAMESADPGHVVCTFGHLGAGNLHYNPLPPAGWETERWVGETAAINRIVHDLVAEMGGSITAEHGVGRLRMAEMMHYKSPIEIGLMRRLKRAFDPAGILNPGKVLPVEEG